MGSTTYGLRSASDEKLAFNEEIQIQSARLLQGLDVFCVCEAVTRHCSVSCKLSSSLSLSHSWLKFLFRHVCVSALKPVGAGGFAFLEHEGQAYLTDVHTQSGIEHFTKIFHDMYGSNMCFASWSFAPNTTLDIWTLWTRFADQGINFIPGSCSKGVFPLLFIKGTTATLIALGETEAEVSALRTKADALVRLVENLPKMESVALNESRNRIWCQSPRIEYRLQTQRYNLPSRCIGLLRPGRDIIVLPGGHEPTKEYWEFAKDVLGFDDDQAIFTTGDSFCLDHDMDDIVLAKLRSNIQTSGTDWTFVPYMVTAQFEEWATKLGDLNLAVFGEELSWVNKFGSKGILHRHIQTLDVPSIIEDIDPNIRVAKGYNCSTVEDLLEAYRLLDCKQVVVKPVFGAAGEGILFLSSAEQLKMYDFPMGEISLEEFLDLDKAADGLVLSPAMHYNEGVLLGKDLVDQIMVGTSYMGWRKSEVPKSFQKAADRYLQTFIQHINPKGPGGVDFLSVKGLPVLSDINTGRFNGAHFPKLFISRWAPGSAFYCWKAAPSAIVDVYGYWNKLVAAGLAFIPGKSTEGVFPLLYLRGMSGLFIAVASTNARAEQFYRQGDELLERFDKRALVQPSPHLVPRPSFFKKADITGKSAIRIWVTSSIPEVRHPQLRIEAPCRPLCLLRPGKDFIVLPGGQENVADFAEFCKEIFHLGPNQFIFAEADKDCLCLDDAVDSDVISKIKDVIEAKSDGDQMVIVPRAVSPNFQSWTSKLDVSTVKVFGEDSDWFSKWGKKNGLFRQASAPDMPSLIEAALGTRCQIRRGFICHSNDELLAAFAVLNIKANEKAWICPVDCHEGRFSKTVGSMEEIKLYHFSDGSVFISKVLSLDKAPDGLPITTSVTYMKGAIFGQGWNDTVFLGNRKQGMRLSVTPVEFQAEVAKLTATILREMKPQGPGSIDFGMLDGKPVLVDMECNSMTTVHYAKLFMETYAPGKVMCLWNSHPPADVDVWTFWSRMLERGLAFVPGKSTSGVFPLLFLKASSTTGHNGTASFVAIAETDAEAQEIKQRAEEALREATPAVMKLESQALDPIRRRIYLMTASQIDPGYKRKYQVASRILPCLRPGMDIIILPADSKAIAEYWDFAQMSFDLEYSQAIFANWNPEDGLDDQVMTQLKAQIVGSPDDKWTLVPYVMTPGIERVAGALAEFGVVVFGEDLEWSKTYGNKSVLHRHIRTKDVPSILESEIDPSIAVAKAFICSDIGDLLNAWKELNLDEAIIKPVAIGNGEGIVEIKEAVQLTLYEFTYGDVILQEKLAVDTAADGLVLASSIHYMESACIGAHKGIMDQILVGNACMGFRKSHTTKIFQKTALRTASTMLAKLKTKGPGRMEFVSVNGAPVLISFVGGRLTHGHVQKMFYDMYGNGKSVYCWDHKPGDDVDPTGFWRRLKNSGAHFAPNSRSTGIFPLQFLRGMAGTFIAFGKDENDCLVMKEKLTNLLKPSVPVLPQIGQQMLSKYELTLIKNAEAIFAPEHIPAKHILVGGTQIVGLLDDDGARAVEMLSSDISTRIIDATGCIVTPGFVDSHVHITGGGGELGPASRTPEAKVNELIEGGLTTVIGVLGTDCISRSLENLVVKCRGLNDEGVTAFMWTGAYRLPTPTLTGTIRRDIVLIEQCIGAGEIAISDHRGSQPDLNTITDAASDCRVGGILAGKAGVMYCHIGTGPTLLGPLWQVVNESQVPIQTFLPTHMERSEALIEDGAKWVKAGGYIDFTCRTLKARLALKRLDQDGVPLERVMVSSDSYGSLPTFDDEGNLIKYTYGKTKAFLQFLFKMYFQEMWPMDKILPLMTSNPASFLVRTCFVSSFL